MLYIKLVRGKLIDILFPAYYGSASTAECYDMPRITLQCVMLHGVDIAVDSIYYAPEPANGKRTVKDPLSYSYTVQKGEGFGLTQTPEHVRFNLGYQRIHRDVRRCRQCIFVVVCIGRYGGSIYQSHKGMLALLL